jgi:glycosyltransferase involved in cell wall biosynthesis
MCDALMIVKNEQQAIQLTVRSLLNNICGQVFVYDTGSSDETCSLAVECDAARVVVRRGEFANFAQARNAAHEWVMSCAREYVWILWVDANDELSGPVPPIDDANVDAYMVCQEWLPHATHFYNNRLFRLVSHAVWHGHVHEWLVLPSEFRQSRLAPSLFCIRQNRSLNCESSAVRWHRDVELLHAQIRESPAHSRAYFYLGRVYKDLGRREEAIVWLTRRLSFADFEEERFWTSMYLAELGESTRAYLNAYASSGRVEPLVAAARLFIARKEWHMALMVLLCAVHLEEPLDCSLFVSTRDYVYERWHLLGIVGYYANAKKPGRAACLEAIRVASAAIDVSNLEWYDR